MHSFILILQIFISISLGYFIAPHLSKHLKQFVFKILPYFSYILLGSVENYRELIKLAHN